MRSSSGLACCIAVVLCLELGTQRLVSDGERETPQEFEVRSGPGVAARKEPHREQRPDGSIGDRARTTTITLRLPCGGLLSGRPERRARRSLGGEAGQGVTVEVTAQARLSLSLSLRYKSNRMQRRYCYAVGTRSVCSLTTRRESEYTQDRDREREGGRDSTREGDSEEGRTARGIESTHRLCPAPFSSPFPRLPFRSTALSSREATASRARVSYEKVEREEGAFRCVLRSGGGRIRSLPRADVR